MKIKEWLEKTYKETNLDIKDMNGDKYTETRPWIKCVDGFGMSVQARSSAMCKPKRTMSDGDYTHVEIGFPTMKEELIMEYIYNFFAEPDPTDAVYGYVPIEIVDQVIEKHGGMI